MAIQTVLCLCVSVMDLVTVAVQQVTSRHTPSRDLTENLTKLAFDQECPFATTAGRENVREDREEQCHIILDHDTELKSTAEFDQENTHGFPDGHIITVVPNVSCGAKMLFQLNFIGKQASGVHDTSFRSFLKWDVDIRKELYVNVVRCHDHIPINFWEHDEGTDGVESIHNEGRNCCSTRVKILGMDLQFFSSRCGPRRAGPMNLALPSSTGSARELTFFFSLAR